MNVVRQAVCSVLWVSGAWSASALAQPGIVTLDEVPVTATRVGGSILQTPASVSVLDGDDVRRDRPQINLSESLGGVPGLQLQNRQNYAQDLQLSLRGFGARATFGVRGVRLYVDGIPATMPDGQGQTSNIDIASLDTIEVLRGPFSALYGNSSGGVLLASTRPGQGPLQWEGSFVAGSDGLRRGGLQASGATELGGAVLDYRVGASRFTTDGYRDHSAARKDLANVRLGLSLDNGRQFSLVVNRVDLRADDPLGLTRAQYEDDPRAASLAQQYNTRKHVRQTQAGLVYEHALNASHAVRLMAYAGQRRTVQYLSIPQVAQLRASHAGGVIDLQRRYAGLDARWTGHWAAGGRPLTVVAGLAYDTMRESRSGYENFHPSAAGPVYGVRGALRRDETNTVWNADPYAQLSWQFAPRWTLDLGARHSTVHFRSRDAYRSNGDDSGSARYRRWLPVAALRFEPSDRWQWYASVGRGFETPTLNELSYRPDDLPGLNFSLQPSVSTNAEVGVKARLGGGLFTVAAFQIDTDDEIVTARNVGGRSSFKNAGRTRRHGIELAWSGELAAQWRLELAYTWLRARYRDDDACIVLRNCAGDAIQAGNRIPGVAEHAAYAALAWQPTPAWRAAVEARYQGAVWANDANTEQAGAYTVMALSGSHTWRAGGWSLTTYARVDNLFNRRYLGSVIVNEGNRRYYEPASGRHWSAGVQLAHAF